MLRRLIVVLAVVPLVAAKPSRPSPAPAPAPAAVPSSAEILAATVGDLTVHPPVTKILDAGAEPRAVVHYQPRSGATVTYENVSRSGLEMTMTLPDGSVMPMPMTDTLPSIVTTLRNTVGAPLPNGIVPVRIEQLANRIDGPAAPEVASAVQDGLDKTRGLTFQLMVGADGRPVQMDIVGGGGDPAMADLLQGIADQTFGRVDLFPREPIGPGARWTSDYEMSMSGLDLRVTQTATARSISATAVDLDLVLSMSLGDGGLTLPGLPPGMVPEFTKFGGTGKGTYHVDLATLVSTGTLVMDIDAAMKLAMPGAGQMSMTMAVHQQTDTRLPK